MVRGYGKSCFKCTSCWYVLCQENLKQLQAQYPERKTKGHYDSMAYFEAGPKEGRDCPEAMAAGNGSLECLERPGTGSLEGPFAHAKNVRLAEIWPPVEVGRCRAWQV